MAQPRAWVAAGLLVLLATACSADQPAAEADGEQAGLSAVAVYGRHAAVRGKVDVRITNEGRSEVVVVSYQVRHPMFDVVPPDDRSSRLPPDGRERIVPVSFGEPLCEATEAEGAVAVLGVRSSEGVRELSVPLADGEPGLARAHRLACAAAAAQEAATFAFGPPWTTEQTPTGPALRTVLRLERQGEADVAVSSVGGNILFTLEAPAGDPVVALAPGADRAEAEVLIRATRCEAHALTESKTSFTFPLQVRVDGSEPSLLQVTVDDAGRAELQGLLDRTCGPALLGS